MWDIKVKQVTEPYTCKNKRTVIYSHPPIPVTSPTPRVLNIENDRDFKHAGTKFFPHLFFSHLTHKLPPSIII